MLTLSRRGSIAVLASIVALGAAMSVRWVFLVPIFQNPDEPQHFDYAISVRDHGGPFRLGNAPRDAEGRFLNRYGEHFLCYWVHPFTDYLIGRSDFERIKFHPGEKMPAEYGTVDYYRALDRYCPTDAPAVLDAPPSLAFIYPCGYYAVIAAWMAAVRMATDSLSSLFFSARLFSTLLSAVGLIAGYGVLRELGCRRPLAIALTAAMAWFPLTTFVSASIQPDNLAFALVVLGFYFGQRLRRSPSDVRWAILLGFSLAMLLLAKPQFFVCTTIPIAGAWMVEALFGRVAKLRAVAIVLILTLPSLAAGLFHYDLVRQSDYSPIPSQPFAGGLREAFAQTRESLHHYFFGMTHHSFWGRFGWMDAPLQFGGARVNGAVQFVIQAAVVLCIVLGVLRFGQIAWRLGRAARRHGRLALRAAASNLPVNAYFLFLVLMVVLFVATGNGFLAQGRHWFPMLLPIFFTSVVYGPKAVRRRAVRERLTRSLVAALLLFCIVGSYFAHQTIVDRYYASAADHP